MSTLIAYPDFGTHSIDRFTEWVEKQLKSIPDLRCERHIVMEMQGWGKTPPCETLAGISDIETELTFCHECYRKYRSGYCERSA